MPPFLLSLRSLRDCYGAVARGEPAKASLLVHIRSTPEQAIVDSVTILESNSSHSRDGLIRACVAEYSSKTLPVRAVATDLPFVAYDDYYPKAIVATLSGPLGTTASSEASR